jgi:KDO2-lipid IV(A) lauroyltransferase
MDAWHKPIGRGLKAALDGVAGATTVALLRAARLADRKRSASVAGAFMRKVGPWLAEHRTGRANLAAAFPEKSPAEIEAILVGVWDNLGRVAAEFAHLDRLTSTDPQRPGPADVTCDQITLDRFAAIRDSRRPTLFFAAHLANWEIPALAAARVKLDTHVLYRPPSIRAVSDAIVKIRAGCMGTLVPSGYGAPRRLANALERGGQAGMLADQYDTRGVDVMFFGRGCKASPLIAKLARHIESDVRGVRIVRLPDGHSFWGEVTEPLTLPRDASGQVDEQQTTQAIASVIEGWVREHPEQWLWLHRRWR